jgi:hypothetical protein
VFERSIYLRAGHTFACVAEPAIGNGPITLIADFGGSRPLSDLKLHAGMSATISERSITIEDSVQFTFDRCELWRPSCWPRARSSRELGDVCRAITRLAAIEAPEEGFGRLACSHERAAGESSTSRLARPRVARFGSWLRGAIEADDPLSTSAVVQAVQSLIGLGPGLTPSGDDFLVGALALLDALAESKAHAALARAIAVGPSGLTSPLSDYLLRAAAAGHVGEHLCRAVSLAISGRAEAAIAAVRNIGHSSGWDMMAGIATTLQAVATARSNTNATAISIE